MQPILLYKNTRHIGYKIVTAVTCVVTLCLITLGTFYIHSQEKSILKQNERTMTELTESVIQALQTIMLSGSAEISRDYADRLSRMDGIVDFRILRVDGTQAFMDNSTIAEVNRFLGVSEYTPRKEEQQITVLRQSHVEFQQVLEGSKTTSYYETTPDGERLLTFLAPIRNGIACRMCHGNEDPVRGVLKFTTSLTPVQNDIDMTWSHSIVMIVCAIISIVILTGIVVNHTIVTPINTVTTAMKHAAKGDLQVQVPVLGRDELSNMATSFNLMTAELARTYTGLRSEQDKLATIILSAQEGIVATDNSGDVVLVNPAAEKLLGKSKEEIIAGGFLNILDDTKVLQSLLDRGTEIREPEIISYYDYVLSVYADCIRNPAGDQMGSATLIRDITDEKILEDRLKRLSITDELTGLYNRRYLDESLASEFSRAKRYKTELSIFMFDVDHFKKFNDEYGHTQGDRVLKMIAEILQQNMRTIDIPCRYGGEEFLAIMPDTDENGAVVVAERTREQIETSELDGLKVTVSIGVTTLSEVESPSEADFLKVVDQALYKAKGEGRNRVIIAGKGSDNVNICHREFANIV